MSSCMQHAHRHESSVPHQERSAFPRSPRVRDVHRDAEDAGSNDEVDRKVRGHCTHEILLTDVEDEEPRSFAHWFVSVIHRLCNDGRE